MREWGLNFFVAGLNLPLEGGVDPLEVLDFLDDLLLLAGELLVVLATLNDHFIMAEEFELADCHCNRPYFIIHCVHLMLKSLEGKGLESTLSKTVVKDLRSKFYTSLALKEDEVDLEQLWPKKGKVIAYKGKTGAGAKFEHIVIDKDLHFIHIDQYVVPTLKTVHAHPELYPKFVADEGAIKFLVKGANVYSPGLTNQNAHMDDVGEHSIVAVYVQNYEHAIVSSP